MHIYGNATIFVLGDIRARLGERICWYRKRAGMTQLALAHALNVDKGTVWRIEDGKVWPELANIMAIAKVLDVDHEAFFSELKPAPPTIIEALAIVQKTLSDPRLTLPPGLTQEEIDVARNAIKASRGELDIEELEREARRRPTDLDES